MKHDRLSKKLLETFFADFLRLIAPDAARRLRLGETSFLDKELCTDWPGGARREVDLLVRNRGAGPGRHSRSSACAGSRRGRTPDIAKRCWSIGSRAMYN